MNKLKIFFPRLRGLINGLIHRQSARKTLLYSQLLFTGRYVKLGKNVFIYKNGRIQGVREYLGSEYSPSIVIESGVSIQQNCHITCAEEVRIGSNTAIGSNVTITDIDHPYCDISLPVDRQQLIIKPVRIGEDCKIYNNAVLLQGTVIGNHCVIGANSVVKGEFPDNSIIVGSPARVIKRYNVRSQAWEKTNSDGSFIEK